MDDVFKCLVKKATDTRDEKPNQWHTLHLDRFAKYSKDCKSVTYNPDKTALPEVNKHRSEDVISDKVVEGCKKL